jgi:hypothetical protein
MNLDSSVLNLELLESGIEPVAIPTDHREAEVSGRTETSLKKMTEFLS